VRHVEAASGDRNAAEQHREKFKKIIEEGDIVSQQVFNCNETPFFGRECHAEHISRGRRPHCLAISR